MNETLSRAIGIAPQIVEWRRALHRIPEPGFREEKTSAFIEKELRAIPGLSVRRLAGTGLVADLDPSGAVAGAPRLLLRADIDALDLTEETGVSYASTHPGFMHACGHDAHAAMLLGAARLLAADRARLRRGVRLVFQPSEESSPGGALALIREGVMEGVEAAIAQHVYPQEPVGTIAVRQGAMMAASDDFDVVFLGRHGHAAQPHDCRDALVAASDFVTRLQSLVSRRFDPFDSVVVTVGSFHAGTRRNIIAGEAKVEGTMRTLCDASRELARRQVETIARSSAAALETGIEFKLIESYPAVRNDPAVVKHLRAAAAAVLGAPNVRILENPSMGSEDFAYYGREVPACLFRLGSGGPDPATRFGHHHPRFDIDETCLPLGAAVLAECALAWRGLEEKA